MELKEEILPISIFLDNASSTRPNNQIYDTTPCAITIDLSIYLKEYSGPLIISHELLHTILAYRYQFLKDIHCKGSTAQSFIAKKKAWSKHKKITIQYSTNKGSALPAQVQNIQKIFRKKPGVEFAYFATTIPFNKWDIYSLDHVTEFYVLIPREQLYYPTELQPVALKKIIKKVKKHNTQPSGNINVENLNKTLAQLDTAFDEQPLLVSLIGHGCRSHRITPSKQALPGTIAYLSPEKFKKFLKFLATLNTQYFYYNSCYAGGNHHLLPFYEETVPLELPYTVLSACIDNSCTTTGLVRVVFDKDHPGNIILGLPTNPQKFNKVISWFSLYNKRETALLEAARHINEKSESNPPGIMVRFKNNARFQPIVDHDSHVISQVDGYTQANISTKAKNLLLVARRMNTLKVESPHFMCLAPQGGVFFINELLVANPEAKNLQELLKHLFFNPRMQNNEISTYILIGLMHEQNEQKTIRNILAANHHNRHHFVLYQDDSTVTKLSYLPKKRRFSKPTKLSIKGAVKNITRTIKEIIPFTSMGIQEPMLTNDRQTFMRVKEYLGDTVKPATLAGLWHVVNSDNKENIENVLKKKLKDDPSIHAAHYSG